LFTLREALKAAIRALLNAKPTPASDIPRKREKKAAPSEAAKKHG